MLKLIGYSNLWIALAAGLDVISTYFILHEPINIGVVLFVFFSTLFIYNFLRVIKSKNVSVDERSSQLKWVSTHLKLITVLIIIGFIGTGICFFFLSTTQKIIALGGGLISILYNFSFFAKNIALRNIPYLKIIIISLTWGIASVLLPFSEYHFYFEPKLFFLRALFIAILLIPFDIRDLIYDDKKMRTLPQVFGGVGAVLLGLIFCLTSICMSFAYFSNEISIPLSINYFFTCIILVMCLRKREEIFYPIVVDGLIITQCLLIGLFVL